MPVRPQAYRYPCQPLPPPLDALQHQAARRIPGRGLDEGTGDGQIPGPARIPLFRSVAAHEAMDASPPIVTPGLRLHRPESAQSPYT